MSVLAVEPLGFPWVTDDPFLFCVHHNDDYPAGNAELGIDRSALVGRNVGADFSGKDGWSMYHGDMVPGFPQHPHRGFETVTLARRGYIDHSDSLGATARFGLGDAQWMTAGRGIVHCEMFPLIEQTAGNPTELFQIWLNLPAASKMVEPYFSMLWGERIPTRSIVDGGGRETRVTCVAGAFGDLEAPPPPPDSWASDPSAHVAIWSIVLDPGARATLPAAPAGTKRSLYFFAGDEIRVAGQTVPRGSAVRVRPDVALDIDNGEAPGEVLLLGGRPLGEPVAQQGPFVMNTRDEIVEAFSDFRRTGFGGWPWKSSAPVHARDAGRFAIHADGRREEPPAR